MAGVTFNISKGREVEFYNRVDTNDPTNSALIMVVLATGGDTIYQLRGYDTLAAVLSGPSNEATNPGYSRKTLTDANLSAWTPDDTNNRVLLTLPLQTFTSITAGDIWDIVLLCYDSDTTGGTDANIVPITASELRINGTAIPPNSDDIVIDFSSGWVMAT
jgi:hypothetical protein